MAENGTKIGKYAVRGIVEAKQSIKDMTERQNFRNELLARMGNDIQKAKAAYDFVIGSDGQEAVSAVSNDQIADGIYLVTADGSHFPFDGTRPSETVIANLRGVGVKMGSRSLVVDLCDQADGKEITLTADKDTTTYDGYIPNFYKAVANYDGKANTEHMKAVGLNGEIGLADGWYIPALGEMYLIFLHFAAINEVLKAVGGQELAEDWYWTSTEYSASSAWYLTLYGGNACHTNKASYTIRVRAVSAFIS